MLKTPILFIVFNRPEPTLRVFESIRNAKPKRLFIAADGPRPDKDENDKCLKVRRIVQLIDWDCEVKTLFQETNLGCRYGVSTAITWFFSHVEEGIILEDDCIPNDSFFKFCSSLLLKYRDNDKVKMISGTSYQNKGLNESSSYYFSRYIHIWGWATWKRAWDLYDVDLKDFNEQQTLSSLSNIFSTKREQNKWLSDFKGIKFNGVNTWDTQWMYAVWKNNGLCIVPWKNMISNIGYGPDATHTKMENSQEAAMEQHDLKEIIHPNKVNINNKADNYIRYKYIINSNIKRIIAKLKHLFFK